MDQTTRQSGIGINPLLSLKRHYRVSVVLFFVILALGMPVAWIKGQSTYSAEAVFQVAPRYMKNLESDAEVELQSNSQYREFVNHLQNTVLRYDVLEQALAALKERGIDTRPPALTRREYIERLQKEILTLAIPDTYMVRVRLNGGADARPHLHEIINAVMTAFLETARIEQIYGSAERYIVLKESQQKLQDEVSGLELQRAQLAARLGLTTFRDGVSNPYDSLLAQLREKLTNATVELKRAEAAHQAFVESREVPTEMGRSLLEMSLGDTRLNSLRSTTHERVATLRQKLSGLGKKHPGRAPAEAEIEALLTALAEAEATFDQEAFANFEARLAASVEKQRTIEAGIRQNVTAMENQASEFAQLYQQAMQLTRVIQDDNERIQQIQRRMNYLETESNALGFVRIVTPALPAEMPMGVGKKKLLLLLLFAALGASLAAPVALDMLDRRIRSVNQAENLLGMPAAGWQIQREDLPTRLFAEEQSRRFAAALIRNRSRLQRNVYAFTSVKLQGGATTTTLDTARTLVGLGARVLVVQANTFTPHAAFADFRPGLSELLIDNLDPGLVVRSVVHRDTVLNIVGVGGSLGNGLQRLDRLRPMLERWASEYEYVLFDLPPILLSADAEMLAEILGQVFLVVECEAVTKAEATRAKGLLQKIDPDAVGLFVNNVPLFRGSGGGYIEKNLVETLTRNDFSRFDAGAYLRLQLQILRTRWTMRHSDRRRRRGHVKRRRGDAGHRASAG